MTGANEQLDHAPLSAGLTMMHRQVAQLVSDMLLLLLLSCLVLTAIRPHHTVLCTPCALHGCMRGVNPST